MKRLFLSVVCLLMLGSVSYAQADKKEVRRGNSDFRRENFKDAEIHYRKGMVQDSTSFVSIYNLANSLYLQHDYDGAANTFSKLSGQVEGNQYAYRYYFNKGNVSLQKRDWKTAIEDFKQCLLLTPSDMAAKESYIYAKKMLEKEQQEQSEDQNDNDDKKDENQDNKEDNQNNQTDQNQDRDNQQTEQNESKISPQQAQQILKAIQAKEKDTQEKVDKQKAEKAKSRQKEKNW